MAGASKILTANFAEDSGPAVPGRIAFAVGTLCAEILTILAVAIVTGAVYHVAVYGDIGEINNYAAVGGLTALIYALPHIFRDAYQVESYLEGRRGLTRTFVVWNTAFLCLGIIGFLTKTTGLFSRGGLILFYVCGLTAVTGLAGVISAVLKSLIQAGRIASRRIMLVGTEAELAHVADVRDACPLGVRVVAVHVLPDRAGEDLSDPAGAKALQASLQDAVAQARDNRVGDIVLLTPWARADLVERIVDAFASMPVSVHLGAASLLGHFAEARVTKLGAITALSVTSPPLDPAQLAVKRIFDVSVASVALVLLSPLFLAIAVLIKLDSPGPVFFRQRRRGYNAREFRSWKFRTMTTLDDGDVIEQARAGDSRVTRIGVYLRRLNFDELPQLINVVAGDMSLVGPRPHAVAHDKMYETRIGTYPRRFNVKPGITGWAQVNGFRGRTPSDDLMVKRVEHDLYYIENWSLVFDPYILALTVLSKKAYRNAI